MLYTDIEQQGDDVYMTISNSFMQGCTFTS